MILCREEAKLINQIYLTMHQNTGSNMTTIFHLVCSFNLNISIVTSFLVQLGMISLNLGAYGYLFGTWLGQVPELIEPTVNKINGCRRHVAQPLLQSDVSLSV